MKTKFKNATEKLKSKNKVKGNRTQLLVFYISLILCLGSLALGVLLLLMFLWEQKGIIDNARTLAKRETVRATLELDRHLREGQETALSIAGSITNGELFSGDEILERLQFQLEQNPQLKTLGIAYEPFAYSANLRRYAPTFIRVQDEVQSLQLEDFYKYDRAFQPPNRYVWYRNTFTKGPHWGEPYIFPDNSLASEPVMGFYTPFFNPEIAGDRPRGVVFTEYSTESLKEIMKSLDLGRTGYAFIVSRRGYFIYHPNEQLVKSQVHILDFTGEQDNDDFGNLVTRALRGEPVEGELSDEITGQDSWVFLRKSNLNGAVVGIVFIPGEVVPDNLTTRRKIIWISLAFLSCLIFLSILICRADKGSVHRLWAATSIITMLLMIEVGYIWYLAIGGRTYTSTRNLLLNDTGIDQLLGDLEDLSVRSGQELPVRIPTGVFVQTIDFVSPKDVFVTGYIWQEYTEDMPEEVIPEEEEAGFLMPDSISSNDLDLTEQYRYKEGDTEVIGWYFEATFRQDFDYDYFPFDYKDLKIRLLPKDFNNAELNRQVVLVPALRSYPVINPRSTPGIAEGIVVGIWDLNDSFFEYKFNNYNTNFGLASVAPKTNYPELHFTIILQRNFLGPFISRVGPQLVVITLVFAVLLIATDENSMEVLGACAGFVFIVILDQITFREQIVSKGIVYLEYFYFLVYLFIFLVAINAIAFLFKSEIPLVEYRNNLVPKLSYWPAIMTLLLVVTIVVFG